MSNETITPAPTDPRARRTDKYRGLKRIGIIAAGVFLGLAACGSGLYTFSAQLTLVQELEHDADNAEDMNTQVAEWAKSGANAKALATPYLTSKEWKTYVAMFDRVGVVPKGTAEAADREAEQLTGGSVWIPVLSGRAEAARARVTAADEVDRVGFQTMMAIARAGQTCKDPGSVTPDVWPAAEGIDGEIAKAHNAVLPKAVKAVAKRLCP